MTENVNPDLEKVRKLALKIKELAQRGVDGERVAAESKLAKILKKYKLSLSDIVSSEKKEYYFPFKDEDERVILSHVIWSVVPEVKIYRIGKNKKVFCELESELYLEIKEKANFYLKHFNEAKNDFKVAYIIKNNLTVKGDRSGKPIDYNERSVISMLSSINEANYTRNQKLIK